MKDNFDYESVNDILTALGGGSVTANARYQNNNQEHIYSQQSVNPQFLDVFGDYFDDGLICGSMAPDGYFERISNIDDMDYFGDYKDSIM